MLKYSSYQSIYTLPASQDNSSTKISNYATKISGIKGFKKVWRVLGITILFMLICTVAVKAFESPDRANNIEKEMVIIQAGDTLWQLATQYKPEKWDTRAFIQVIQKANNMKNSVIHAGEVIAIPILD
ncbi:LysM repeat protein [Paenibacillus turicensis]|uniref:LysM repeat protein n=1 Tax=Paenibacillus turicensis TaxID=160487 RepID=A0ABS4FWR8_9BACL|nr:LysM peptidoglycan-binding domain-containing protein [Paenibacillus turicensis]MBP1907024.1 LysM repeat protein [Paenibacillus turicensis]